MVIKFVATNLEKIFLVLVLVRIFGTICEGCARTPHSLENLNLIVS